MKQASMDLRDVFGVTDPLEPTLTEPWWVAPNEIRREAATLVTLIAVGWAGALVGAGP